MWAGPAVAVGGGSPLNATLIACAAPYLGDGAGDHF